MSSSPPRPTKIDLTEEAEGDRTSVSDHVFFHSVGEPIRIRPKGSAAADGVSDSAYWFPTQPVVASDKLGLLFVAHSSGFCVARTKDVMEAAKGKGSGGCSVTEMSVVNVDVGNVRLLALSRDSSVLAVCAGCNVSFFSVDALCNKEEGSLSSRSIDDSTFIKDFRWLKTTVNSFIILSGSGELSNGSVGGPLKSMMHEVDAVECSPRGKSIVVARSNNLSFLTTKFKEKKQISLSGPSWTGDGSYKINVDSIRWVRPDSIVLGCFQLQSDGTEDNYFLQVIRSKDSKITDSSAEMIVQSFYYVFPGMVDDIVPSGNGPYLFVSYLEQCELAVIAHRKNIEEHMVFFSWSVSKAKDEVVFVEIDRNKWLPKIELQENEEDNLILGVSSCKVSLDEKVRIQMSSDLRELELSPFSVMFSVTVEGKLVMHHVSSNIELSDSLDVQPSEDEEDTLAVTPSKESSATTLAKGSFDHGMLVGQFQDIRRLESSTKKEKGATSEPDLKPLKTTQSQTPTFPASQTVNNESMAGKWGVNSVALSQKSNSDANLIDRVGNQSVGVPSNEGTFGGMQSGVLPQLKMPTFTTPVFSEKSKPLTGQWKMESHPQSTSANQRQHPQVDNHSAAVQSGQGLFGGKQDALSQQSAAPFSLSKELKNSLGSKEVTRDHNRLRSVETSRSSLQETPVLRGGSGNQFSSFQGEERSGTQLGKMKGMINELDALLSSLQERGGLTDACTVAMKGSVETVENEIGTLSNHCLMWKAMLNERENEIQALLTKSIQAVVVKEHVEILLKQASDPHYRELWSWQKLSAELELKRKNILKLNQELTNRLIELESHLNSLELNKYGDMAAAYRGRQVSERGYGRRSSTTTGSRSAHSLQSLYSTITSQIASAEQLSDCLSRQMSALSVESPPARPNNVKKELFDSIGLPYEDSLCSPDLGKISSNSLDKRTLISSNSVAAKDLYVNVQSSALKLSEPETARRRRDSLGQGWKSFTPSKTTVKRIVLEGQHDKTTHQSSKSDRSIDSLEKSALPLLNRSTPTFKLHFESSGSLEENVPSESSMMPYNGVNEGARFVFPTSQAGSISQVSQSRGSVGEGWSKTNISSNFVLERTNVGMTGEKSTLVTETQIKPAIVQESISLNGSNVSMVSALKEEMPTVSMKSLTNSSVQPTTTSGSILKERSSSSSRSETQKDRLKKDETPPFGLGKIDSSPSIAHPGPKALPFTDEVPPFGAVVGQSSPSGITSTATSLEPAPSSLLSTTRSSSFQPISFSVFKNANPFAGVSSLGTPAISTASKETSQSPSSGFFPSVSASPATSAIPLLSSSALSPLSPPSFQSKASPVQDKMPETVKLDVKPGQDKDIPRLDVTPSSEVKSESLSGGSPVKIEAPAVMTPAMSETSPAMAPELQEPSNGKGSLALHKLPDAPPEKPPIGNIAFPFALSTAGNFTGPKTESVDIAADLEEDEMEEEAPDTNNKPDLDLGGLGGFGLGSTPNSNTPKGNPFGISFSTATSTPVSSPFSMSVPSGELFRPASFSFQSPQTSQPSQPPTMGGFSGGFGVTAAQAPTQSGFGQPSQIGPGQPALGSVLGTFGQSRQIGSGFAPSGGFGGGFPAAGSASGFAGAASTGGFASLTSTGSGFAAGGFTSVPPAGGGFGGFAAAAASGGGFANAATGSGFSTTGFGFGAFGSQQGAGGFSAFSGSGAGAGNTKPPELFTQIRK
ncbi:hypothetical protein MLD38_004256 [Melastoma candidum]|uniref:Uncharacterized protein n=1 Tax=Melastoma candidum TaxID=119954 RepID=A0ACB9S5Y2_9MYRT|nr:hypothetical protein MLD38_004256 [Melastoma candidum]